MKTVQVGILIALVLVAGLLVMVYKQQSAAPTAEPQAMTTPPAPGAAEPAQTASPAAAESAPPAASPAPAAEAVEKRPPAPRSSRTAQTRPRETPPPVESAPARPSPAPPAQTPPPAEPPAEKPQVALTPPSRTQTAPREPQKVTIPAGTLLTVRLLETVSTDHQQTGDSFAATLDQPLVLEGFVIAERGARVQGRVLEAEKAGRVRGTATLAIHLVRLRSSDGQDVTILTEKFVKRGETTRREDAAKVGAGAAIGAAIGAIAGGGKGAAVGAAAGGAAGAGTVAATRGEAAELPSETRLTFRLQEAVTLTEKTR